MATNLTLLAVAGSSVVPPVVGSLAPIVGVETTTLVAVDVGVRVEVPTTVRVVVMTVHPFPSDGPPGEELEPGPPLLTGGKLDPCTSYCM